MEKKHPSDLNYMSMLKMDPMTESLTAHNGHPKKHVNLVQMKKIKMDNSSTVSLDIISSKCENETCQNSKFRGEAPSRRIKTHIAGHSDGSLRNLLLAFSWRQNFVLLSSEFTEHCITDVVEISGLRVFCVLWIILVHVTTVLYYVAGEFGKSLKFRGRIGTFYKRHLLPMECPNYSALFLLFN